MSKNVSITAPSRLHFGLFSFRPAEGSRGYGGVGAMIDRPGLALVATAADGCTATGPHAERALGVARGMHAALGRSGEPGCHFHIVRAAPLHVGLGTGTQLAFSVATALAALYGLPSPTADELARWTVRGRRSAVGAHGFLQGGLIVESGKPNDQSLSPLAARVAIPPDWRFVLVRPRGERGLSGDAEEAAFESLAAPNRRESAAAEEEVFAGLVPAFQAADSAAAADRLFRFGRFAGRCFAAWQGGTYASGRLTELVEAIRGSGWSGVGQSSWGPTLYVLAQNVAYAEECVAMLRRRPDADDLLVDVAAPCNDGARMDVVSR